ncbi:MAG: Cell division protein FtsH [uncultured Frankineae bacterium]|uniref:Cell division protein FtsH n=1 Tax=uncultured Frankineae bacterium TaxID=437475 RepID=A0A6J4LJ81_9ACTN|nr:MAG: Cell division protein FtsH [uncultured Frankineae bacterium]
MSDPASPAPSPVPSGTVPSGTAPSGTVPLVASQLAGSVRELLDWLSEVAPRRDRDDEVAALVLGHLGDAGRSTSVVSREIAPFEQVNLQVALSAWAAEPGRTVDVQGLALSEEYGPTSLQDIVHGEVNGPLRLSAPDIVDLPSGPDRTTACWRSALLLVRDDRGPYVLLVRGPSQHDPRLSVQVAGLETAAAQDVQRELSELRTQLSVYRGQLLELQPGGGIVFPELPATAREDVVLPEQVLRRIERHTLDVAARRADLQAAGQHLKRGLLLYGPPGTGKTHTTRYVVQQLAGSTVFLLSGPALHMVDMVTSLARELAPAVLVLEDVDLVAEDRGFGDGPHPVLFSLLDAMDGAAADADLLFLLTTNRADLLEPALAARPGRVDVAVEIDLPDPDARRRLFDVYTRGVPLEVDEADVDAVVERTEGVTASFIKELVRRAVLESLHATPGPLTTVSGEHLSLALDDLLDSTQAVTRALLGVPADQSAPPMGPPLGMPEPGLPFDRGFAGHRGAGWMTYGLDDDPL